MNIHVKASHSGFAYKDILRGVSAKSVLQLIDSGTLTREDVFRLIPERTFMRRVAEDALLRIEEADAIARLLRVFDTALWALGDAVKAKLFMDSANAALDGHVPRVLAATDAGAREIEGLLHRFVFGDVG